MGIGFGCGDLHSDQSHKLSHLDDENVTVRRRI